MEFDGLGAESARYFYHTDHLGSVRLLTDAGGGVARTYDYTAYGVRLDDPAGETTLNPFTYTGREYHAPSRLYFYRARFYDPEVGQFLSVDPIGQLGGANLYSYVGGTPTAFSDPFGWYRLVIAGQGVRASGATADYDVSRSAELVDAIRDSVANHPGEQITEFVLIAHGDKQGGGNVYLGIPNTPNEGRVTDLAFRDDTLNQFAPFFAEDAEVIIVACRAAQGGRGERLIQQFGRAFLRQNGGKIRAYRGPAWYIPGLGPTGVRRIERDIPPAD